MLRRQDVPATFVPDLLAEIERSTPAGSRVRTLASGQPNTVEAIEPGGVWITTERSAAHGGSELVPAWMFNVAWHELISGRSLQARELVKTVKRSSAVCALLAQLPDVDIVSSHPIELRLHR